MKAASAKGSYQADFLVKFRHPSAIQVVNEVRDFVTDFPSAQTKLQAAQRVHDFLSVTTPKLVLLPAFADDTSEEARISVQEGLERFVLQKLHRALYRPLASDVEQDEIVDKILQERLQASAGLESLGPDLSQESQETFRVAAAELRKVDQYKIPRDKVICMLNAYRLVDNIVWELGSGLWAKRSASQDDLAAAENLPQNGDGDVLHRVLEALVIEASPPSFFSNLEFAATYRHPPRLTAEERRCLRDFSSALGAVTGYTPKVPTTAIGAGGSWTWGGFEELPPWLEGTGVSFRFEGAEASNLLLGEVDELLGAYHRMASVLRTLAESPALAK